METRICKWHNCKKPFKTDKKIKSYCSFKCKNKGAVDRRRKMLKELAIEYKGSKCQICGYNRCKRALDFHHLDPSKKEFGLGAKGITRSWEKTKSELDKCILVCSNCHREIEDKIYQDKL